MKIDWTDPFTMLHRMTGENIMVKDSLDYKSMVWKPYSVRSVEFPVQRQLTAGECVLDFDGVSEREIIQLIEYYTEKSLKFIVWKSSDTGYHLHFWTDVYGKHEKAELVRIIAEKTFEEVEIKPDLLPMGHGFIRSENSVHPVKKSVKTLYYSTLVNNFVNEITGALREAVDTMAPRMESNSNRSIKNRDDHGCIRYLRSNSFTDGRKRLMFALISYYKNSMSNEALFSLIVEWCQQQNYKVGKGMIRAQIQSNRGLVGCNFRHNLLEELGHTFKCGD